MLHRTGVVMAPRSGIPGDGSDAAARRGVEGMRRPQWTMSSSVKDILLEGSTLRTDMKLNDFLRRNLGGKGVVKKNENVAMEVFVQEPDAYVKKQQHLRIIFNLTEYQVLEAIYKLHHEGVDSLEQWRDYEGKDTVTLHARRNLNRVLTQVLREQLEAEERAVREKQVGFILTTTIRDVLLGGRFRVDNKKLNDFLMMELEGRGVVATNRNVLLKEFLKDPTGYIRDAGALGEIQATDAYARMEGTVREEMGLEEVVRRLSEKGVNNLLRWSEAAAEVKATVHDITKNSLNAALEWPRILTKTSAPEKLEGLYESVYNARWHHVVEVSDGEGTGMEMREGEPPQSWTYKAFG
ncbi:retrotransposon hot spot (RHS) protein [Trypanosoma cruzi]|nr:retrotransposon hot spot (RHS) protein [Trypanosoma cruzi]